MDLALARRSGQELRNSNVITKSPDFAPLCIFFTAAVNQLQMVFDSLPVPSGQPPARSLIATMRAAVEDCDISSEESLMLLSPQEDLRVATLPVGSSLSLSSVDDATPPISAARRLTSALVTWPSTDRRHLLAVANQDIRVARQNLAELQLYVDDHAAHVANCAGAEDTEIPLMSAETFPHLEGGIRAVLEEVDRR